MKIFLDEIDELVGSALTAASPAERTRLIGEALKKVCIFLQKLNRRAEFFVEETLAISAIGTEGVALRLKDYVAKHDEFAVFQNMEQLREFLVTTRSVLMQQGYLNDKRLNEIIRETREVYQQMLEESVSVVDFMDKFKMLARFFCRPPEGHFGDDPKAGGGGGGGASETRGEKVSRYIQTGASVIEMVHTVIESCTAMKKSPETALEVPLSLRLFVLIRLSAFATMLNNQDEIPLPPIPVEETSDPAEQEMKDRQKIKVHVLEDEYEPA